MLGPIMAALSDFKDSAGQSSMASADIFAGPLVTAVFGDVLHPGGEDGTLALAAQADLPRGSVVVDAAGGAGVSARALAQKLGWRMVGIDARRIGSEARRGRRHAGSDAGSLKRVGSVWGMAGAGLPLRDASVDGILSECSFCLVDDGKTLTRYLDALRPGGKLMLADVTLEEPLPSPPAWAATLGCVQAAMPLDALRATVEAAGFEVEAWDDRRAWLASMREHIHARIDVDTLLPQLRAASSTRALAEFVEALEAAFASRNLGYVSCVGKRPVD